MRLIDADALMDIFADRLIKVSERYGVDSAVAGAVSGAMRLVDTQPTIKPEQIKMIKEIRKWINSGNRGSADYFIVDKIEEIINKKDQIEDQTNIFDFIDVTSDNVVV